jgi:hypothetical protein
MSLDVVNSTESPSSSSTRREPTESESTSFDSAESQLHVRGKFGRWGCPGEKLERALRRLVSMVS